jgi:hypothetical protein
MRVLRLQRWKRRSARSDRAVSGEKEVRAYVSIELGCYTLQATGLTNYLINGGILETGAEIAGHASTKTTQLYDRRPDNVTHAEIERIRIGSSGSPVEASTCWGRDMVGTDVSSGEELGHHGKYGRASGYRGCSNVSRLPFAPTTSFFICDLLVSTNWGTSGDY